MSERQIVLDTETTGLEPSEGHRIIEIGCVVMEQRRVVDQLHWYLNPERDIDEGAFAVHGISRAFLADKPRFAERAAELLDFLRGHELLIHNADFDVGFLDHELALAGLSERIGGLCTVTDTWAMAKRKHPGQKNSLDALCKRYMVDNSNRELHGALLDAQLLAEVYLALTGGQESLALHADGDHAHPTLPPAVQALVAEAGSGPLPVIEASEVERADHDARLGEIRDKAGHCLWTEAG
ncbi:DNA polymerase III subunit epsilon [Algiphilus aromaticivorans]|jgi:DNA polymerase-3 subunit epsilon|uniref:DNA polymerase III subunit epsilon n=1 Tax=Algiphilus aromaticivorans TaxID=382454 RepID=UPI0005C14FB5|nr:DNA polymerase III subunit epsilon [Algiphilus aromaticivorans]